MPQPVPSMQCTHATPGFLSSSATPMTLQQSVQPSQLRTSGRAAVCGMVLSRATDGSYSTVASHRDVRTPASVESVLEYRVGDGRLDRADIRRGADDARKAGSTLVGHGACAV